VLPSRKFSACSFFLSRVTLWYFKINIFGCACICCLVFATNHQLLYQRQTSTIQPRWLTKGGINCLIKSVITLGNITITSTHSLRSQGKLHGRISRCSKAASINLPSMRGVMCLNMNLHKLKIILAFISISFLITGFTHQQEKSQLL
jgi:hypothetical protein